jgi:hypothetical protein
MKIKTLLFAMTLFAVPLFSQGIVAEFQTRCPWGTGSWLLNQDCLDAKLGWGTFSASAEGKINCTNGYFSPIAFAGVTASNCTQWIFLDATAKKKPADVGDRIETVAAAYNEWSYTLWVMNDWRWCDGSRYLFVPSATPC